MIDEHAANELKLYIDNDGDLYRRQTTSILKNLVTKRARGEYKHDLAVKAFGYLVEEGAKKYAREFGSSGQAWHKMFDTGTREQVAEELTSDFEVEAALGNYDHLLPKKYQGQETSGGQRAQSHACKKSVVARRAAPIPSCVCSERGECDCYRQHVTERCPCAFCAGEDSGERHPALEFGPGHAVMRKSLGAPRSRAQLDADIVQALRSRGYQRGGWR